MTVPDVPSTLTLHQKTEEALTSGTELYLEEFESATGFPDRLLLPRGNSAGMEYKLVVMVSDGEADAANMDIINMSKFHHYGHHGVYPDKRPHGYPLDRRVPDERVFHELPNFHETIVKVHDFGEHICHDLQPPENKMCIKHGEVVINWL